jgi:hypothetical protein
VDPRFDEPDAGSGAEPEPEAEREPVTQQAADQAPEPAADDESELEPEPEPALEPESALEPEPVAESVPEQESESGAPAEEPDPLADPQAATVLLETEAEPEERGSLPHRMRMGFRTWRRSRPFWGAFLVILGGLEILYSEKAPLRVVVHFGPLGIAGYLLPLIMVLCGLLMWFNPVQRTFYSILSVLLALGTWITSNLGGFIIGLLLGVVGGSLAFGWSQFTDEEAADRDAKRRRKRALRAKRKADRRHGAAGTRTAQSGRVARTVRTRRADPTAGTDPELGKPTEA